MNPRQAALLLALGAIWGASFLFNEWVLEALEPVALITGRLLIGAALTLSLAATLRLPFPSTHGQWLAIAVAGLLGNAAPFCLISWGQQHLESGAASVLNSSTPLFTALVAAVALRSDHLLPVQVLGLVIGFAGVVALSGSGIVELGESGTQGQLAVVGASFCYALAAVFMRLRLRSGDIVVLTGLQLAIAGMVTLVPALIFARPDLGDLPAKSIAGVICLGVMSSAAGQLIYLTLLRQVGPVKASTVTYIVPGTALLLGWLVLDEGLGWNTLGGLALIATGVAVVNQVKPWSLLRRAPLRRRRAEPALEAEGLVE